jgi:hypothetical protein
MWLFGQVWFACLVGFAVGVALDWVVRVRPLSRRITELEAQLAAANRRLGAQDGDGAPRSVFDRGFGAEPDADGFVTERNRGGLLTPSSDPTLLSPQLADEPEASRPDSGATTVMSSGVEDFPGVSRLSGVWDTDQTEAVAPPSEQPWQSTPEPRAAEPWQSTPEPPAAEPWQQAPAEQPWEPAAPAGEATAITPAVEPEQPFADQPFADQPFADQEVADQQYLEFLRAGANHAPPPEADEPAAEDVTTSGGLVRGHDYTGQEYTNDFETPAETTGELPEPGAAEVTSVMRPVGDEQPRLDSYDAYESYAQDDYQQNGYSATDSGGYQFGSYQPEEFEEPAESSTPLPRRSSGEHSLRFAPFSPFEIPFDTSDTELVDVQPRSGELTPIEEGGFQPFQKPAIEETAYSDGAWIGDDGQLVGMPAATESAPPTNGAHTLAADPLAADPVAGDQEDAGSSSWFDLSGGESAAAEQPRSDTGMTQRMLPVSRPDLDHPDLLPASVFGTETDTVYEEEATPRSLFEPVVQPEALVDDFSTPPPFQPATDYTRPDDQAPADPPPSDYAPSDFGSSDYAPSDYSSSDFGSSDLAPADFGSSSFGSSDFGSSDFSSSDFSRADDVPSTETTEEFVNAPRPVRVRTGVEGGTESNPAMSPVQEPEPDRSAEIAPGPFGPGSALPNPDGSAPSPDFHIKARTSSMVFHTESSPFYERLEPQVWFRDAEEAQRAGFTSWERPRGW